MKIIAANIVLSGLSLLEIVSIYRNSCLHVETLPAYVSICRNFHMSTYRHVGRRAGWQMFLHIETYGRGAQGSIRSSSPSFCTCSKRNRQSLRLPSHLRQRARQAHAAPFRAVRVGSGRGSRSSTVAGVGNREILTAEKRVDSPS